MTDRVLKRLLVVFLATCMCFCAIPMQAADSGSYEEDPAAAVMDVTMNETAEPAAELPVLEMLPEELPAVEEPISEEPVIEEPVIEEPVIEETVIEEPVIEEPVIEEPVIEEPVIEEPVIEEPVIEEPAIEEPVIEEPAIEEPVIEEPAIEEPVIEEPVIEEPAIEEPAIEEPVIEEPAIEEPVTEDPNAVVPVIEEPAAPETAEEEPIPTEPTEEDADVVSEEISEEEIVLIEETLEIENAIPSSAVQIRLNGSYPAYFYEANEVEYYWFTPETTGWYTFYSFSMFDHGDPCATLYDSNMNELKHNDDAGDGFYPFRIDYYMTAGTTYVYGVQLQNGEVGDCAVYLEKTLVTSLSVEPIEIIEYTNGSWNGTGDTSYYYYNIKSLMQCTIVYEGTTYQCGFQDVLDLTHHDFLMNNDSLQDTAHWTVGNTYTVTAAVQNQSCQFTVKIIPSPLTSFSAEPVDVIEGTCGSYRDNDNYSIDYSDSGPFWYFYEVTSMPLRFTVIKDGQSFTGTMAELYQKYGYHVTPADYNYGQSPNNKWTVGQTYYAGFSFMGMDTEVEIHIVPTQVSSFTIDGSVRVEGTDGYRSYYYIDNDSYPYFKYYLDKSQLVCHVTFKNGTTFSGTLQELEEASGYRVTTKDAQGVSEQWTAGETYSAAAWFMNKMCFFGITIIPDETTWEYHNGVLTVHSEMQNWAPETVPWRQHIKTITKVVIDPGVTKIGNYAFSDCIQLTSIEIPDSIRAVGAYAFNRCTNLSRISLPDQVSFIDRNAFQECTSLTSFTIPGSVTKIVYHTFQNCTNLANISMPKEVKKIGYSAFASCNSLSDVYYGGTEADKAKIVIEQNGNQKLMSATWHYENILTGWQKIDGKWYYLENGEPHKGWLLLGGKYFYLDPQTGVLQVGLMRIDGKFYYFSPTTGEMQTGLLTIGGKYYYFSPSTGALQTGIVRIGRNYYYFSPTTGEMQTGFREYKGYYYYFSPTTGKMQTGWILISGCYFFMDPMFTGWIKYSGKYYYLESLNGEAHIGWLKYKDHYYYMDPPSGAMHTGWLLYEGKFYYFDPITGVMQTGWVRIDRKSYYFDPETGALKTGPVRVGGRYYYLSPTTGAVQTGLVSAGGRYYYFSPTTGALQTGWMQYGGKYYYFSPATGAMVTGSQNVNGRVFYFGADGALIR